MKSAEEKRVEITSSMGSSCYARGKGRNLEMIEAYIEEHGLDVEVTLTGSRCEGSCADGPNLRVDGRRFGRVDRETLIDILKETSPAKGAAHE